MTVREILRAKGSEIHSISPEATLQDVAVRLVENHCGSLLICDDRSRSSLVGIITERDLLRAAASNGGSLERLSVRDYMTTRLITGHPDSTIEEVMGIMTEHRIRHLPVMDGPELTGVISIGDVVKAQHHEMAQENHYLKSYIHSQ